MQIGNRTQAFEWYHFQWPWASLSAWLNEIFNDTKITQPLCDSWASYSSLYEWYPRRMLLFVCIITSVSLFLFTCETHSVLDTCIVRFVPKLRCWCKIRTFTSMIFRRKRNAVTRSTRFCRRRLLSHRCDAHRLQWQSGTHGQLQSSGLRSMFLTETQVSMGRRTGGTQLMYWRHLNVSCSRTRLRRDSFSTPGHIRDRVLCALHTRSPVSQLGLKLSAGRGDCQLYETVELYWVVAWSQTCSKQWSTYLS